MRALTAAQRRGYTNAAIVLYVLGGAAIVSGIWVGLEWPLGWAYGGLGIIAGAIAVAVGLVVQQLAKRSPAA